MHRPFSPIRFRQYARELSAAIYDLSREQQMRKYGVLSRKISVPPHVPAPSQRRSFMTEPTTPESTPLPNVEIAPGQPPLAKPASGSFAASIRAIMDDARADIEQARADGLSKVREAVGKLTEAKAAIVQVTNSMAKTIEDEAASVTAELGQISNFPPE
jgi:hypothetical protein